MLERKKTQTRTFLRRFRAFLGKRWVVERTRIIAPSEDRCTNPIFVIGTHRSGTSLLRRVMNSHRNIACPPESFYLRHFDSLVSDKNTWDCLSAMGFDRDEATNGLRHCAGYFHELYRRSKGKPRWADKTPQYVYHLDAIDQLFGPGAQYLFIFRHPFDVAFSIWKHKWRFDSVGIRFDDDLMVNTCRYMEDSVRRQLAFVEKNPGRCHVFYYDELVREPRKTLERVCEFLKEPFDEQMLRFHEVQHDVGVEDPIVDGTRGFSGSFMNWKEWTPEDEKRALDILGPTLDRLGYSTQDGYSRNSRL